MCREREPETKKKSSFSLENLVQDVHNVAEMITIAVNERRQL
jgi:hypothetical protein